MSRPGGDHWLLRSRTGVVHIDDTGERARPTPFCRSRSIWGDIYVGTFDEVTCPNCATRFGEKTNFEKRA